MRPAYAMKRSGFVAIWAMVWLALSFPAAADEREDCEKLKGLASIEACTQVIEAGTYGANDLAVAYLNRGLENFARRDYDQAVADYTAAIALDGKNADIYNNRGNAYHARRDYPRALRDFDKAIARNPAHALAYNNRGIVYGDMGDFARAIQDYDQAIAIHPAYASAYNNRGNIHAKQGDFRMAVQDYSQAIVLKPSYVGAYNNRAMAYGALGQYAQAADDFRQSMALRPNETAKAGLAALERRIAVKAVDLTATPMSFRRMPNTDLAGALLDTVTTDDLDACEAACAGNGYCRAYSFNMWNGLCFLKGDPALRYLEPSTMSGLKSETYPPPISDAGIAMVRFRNKAFPGEPVRQSQEKRFEDCEATCQISDTCIAFSFIRTEKSCRMFEKPGAYVSDAAADSGAKRQIVN